MGVLGLILTVVYLGVPLVAGGVVIQQALRRRSIALAAGFLFTCASGLVIGASLAIVYAIAVGGRVMVGQVLITWYFAVAALLLLKALSRLLEWGALKSFGLLHATGENRGRYYRTRLTTAFTVRALLLYAVGLPYVMGVAMVYRPKAAPSDDPYQQLGFRFEPVRFTSTDGIALDGWWIPARKPSASDVKESPDWGRKTVVLCHGLGANKSNQLVMAQDLVPGGYNVLTFDFRAHGRSGGQVTTFGDRERRDVLGAVRWLRRTHAEQSTHIYGAGASMGAAALIAAAADASEEGQALEALAVYGTYDDLGALVRTLANDYFVPPLDWLAVRAALPVASLHAGRDLAAFRPGKEVQALWPRPILVIHGKNDRIIDFRQGENLLDHALQPKYHYWVTGGDHNGVVSDPVVSKAVLLFFDNARSII